MKITIIPRQKRVIIRGNIGEENPEEFLSKIFEDLIEYSIKVEKTSYPYPELQENQTTTAGQSGL